MRATLLLTLVSLVIAMAAAAQVTVVDIIPNTMNNETATNAEPNLTVDPANPQRMAASVFMNALMGMTNGPILVSFDGGTTWVRRNIIPTCNGCSNTGDITLRFAVSGANQNQASLYAGILSNAPMTPGMAILRTTDQLLNSAMTPMTNRAGPDQPYIQARGLIGWFDPGKERTYTGNNDSGGGATTATVDHSLDTAAMAPAFTTTRIDFGAPNPNDNYQVRPAVGADGHVYAAFYRRLGFVNNVGYNADVVIVRDDNWGNVAMPWRNLADSGNMVVGQRVASNITVTDDCCCGGCIKSPPVFPGQRQGGDLFLTTDPNDANIVYISWADRPMGDPMTLHLRRSNDAGQTWPGPDLLTIPSAKNAAIAVNSSGHIAYLYQQWTGMMPNHRWQTHLRRWNGMAWDDTQLSDMPCEMPCGWTGDYDYVTAAGKNFYGVFSALNTPATLPNTTVFLRNHDGNIPTTLLKDDNTAVGNSVDPFFFRTEEMAPSDDVYVRDWTDSALVFDRGLEPSTHSDFFHFSDVWNERVNDPLAFDGSNRPQSNDPQPMAMGQNFAFARVSREASLNAVDVTLEFLFSDGGVGVNYVSAGGSPLHLNMGQAQANLTAGNGHAWDLPSGMSNHVCLAVQISSGTDPFIGTGLAGHAPGWPGTDLEIVNDNNKAQRNMHVYMGMSGGGGMSMYAIAHNAATFVRDMVIGLDAPRWTGPKGPTVAVVGGQERTTIRGRTALTLPRMRPGENRWVEVTADPTAKDDADSINLYEVVNGRMINGYAFVPQAADLGNVALRNLFQHAVVFTRMAVAFGVVEAKREADEATRTKVGSADDYLQFLKRHRGVIQTAAKKLRERGGGDPFGIADAAKQLETAGGAAAAANAHLTLLNKLDAFMTMLQKRDGDAADIAQTLRMQAERLRMPKLLEAADRFARGKGTAQEYSALVQAQADALRDSSLRAAAASTTDLARLQKLHRDALLAAIKE